MDKVCVEKKDGIVHVKINRPAVMNACDGETYHAIADAWDELDSDPQCRVGIVSGEGSAFCVGTDIKWVASPAAKDFEDRLYPRLMTLSKPLIAAIHGHCNGGGLEQALAADIRVAAEDAQFGFGEARLGWIPGGHGTQRLPRLIPLGNALEMLYTGRRIDAAEALRLGLVNRVVPVNELMVTCEHIAMEIIRSAPLAVQQMKAAVMQGLDVSLPEAVRIEKACFERLMQTADAKEGARAFAEKRPPTWRGE